MKDFNYWKKRAEVCANSNKVLKEALKKKEDEFFELSLKYEILVKMIKQL